MFTYAQFAKWFFAVMGPLLLVLGTVGSVMTVVVMRRLTSGHSTPCIPVYFTALAISDWLLLVAEFPSYWCIFYLGTDYLLTNLVLCKSYVFLLLVLSSTSAWYLVAMTCQRAISVLWPFKVEMQSRKRAIIVVSVITVLSMILFSWLPIAETVFEYQNITQCGFDPNNTLYSVYMNVHLGQNLVMVSFVPLCVLVVSNSLLIWKIRQSARRARSMIGAGQQSSARQSKTSSLTVTVVMTSVAFIVLMLPLPVYIFVITQANTGLSLEIMMSSLSILYLMWYSNAALHFYLYCLTGTKFRRTAQEALTEALAKLRCRLLMPYSATASYPATPPINNDALSMVEIRSSLTLRNAPRPRDQK
jgi:growth hormone secretagogue receptor